MLNDVGNSERLAAAGDTEQRLMSDTIREALTQLLDSRRLIALWLEVAAQTKTAVIRQCRHDTSR
jgi:hypothetical protein